MAMAAVADSRPGDFLLPESTGAGLGPPGWSLNGLHSGMPQTLVTVRVSISELGLQVGGYLFTFSCILVGNGAVKLLAC